MILILLLFYLYNPEMLKSCIKARCIYGFLTEICRINLKITFG